MSTKQQSMKARKQQRAKNKSGKGTKAKINKTPVSDQKIASEIAKHGIQATAEKYKDRIKHTPGDGPTPETISEGFIKFIDVIAPIHSTVEIAEQLVNEGKIKITPEQQILINKFDEDVVHSCEDIAAINMFLKEGCKFEDFSALYIHFVDLSASMMEGSAKEIYHDYIKEHRDIISVYAKEHKVPNETDISYALRVHDQRMTRILPLYRTIKKMEDLIPEPDTLEELEEFIPEGEVSTTELENDFPIKDVN